MRLLLFLKQAHLLTQDLFISLYLLALLFLVLAVNLVPFRRILWGVILCLPVGDVAGYEGAPELSILAFDLW